MIITNLLAVTHFAFVRFSSSLHSLVATDLRCLRQESQHAGLSPSLEEGIWQA